MFLLLLLTTVAFAEPKHGCAILKEPKYPKTFKHFDYVNPNAPKGGGIRMGVLGSFDSFNPFIIKGIPAHGVVYCFATLLATSFDEPSASYAYVADSIDILPDFTSVTFTLNQNARFDNGDPITVDDVIFSFRILKERGNPLFRQYYKLVDRAEKISKHCIKFHAPKNKSREIGMILGQLPILSSKSFSFDAFDKNLLSQPISSGPYRIKNFQAGRQLVLEKVPNWWAKNIPSQIGQYNFDKVIFEYFHEDNALFEAFKNGSLDFKDERSAKRWMTGYDFPAVHEGKIIKIEVPNKTCNGSMGFFFNLRRPIFSDIRVREAISKMFDFEWINKNIFYSHYKRSLSYFPSTPFEAKELPEGKEKAVLSAYKSQLPKHIFEKAFHLPTKDIPKKEILSLLRQAGWIIKNQTIVNQKTLKPLSFSLMVTRNIERIALHFQACLKRFGIHVNIQIPDGAVYQTRIDDFDFDMTFIGHGQSLTPGNEQRQFWASEFALQKGTQNYGGIQNKVVDALVEHLIDSPTYEDLVARTKALDRVLLWHYYMIPSWGFDKTRIAFWSHLNRLESEPLYIIENPVVSWWMQQPQEKITLKNKQKKHSGSVERFWKWVVSFFKKSSSPL